jgi:regulator of sigma E protease
MERSIEYIHAYKGKNLLLSVQRGDKMVSVSAQPTYNSKLKVHLIGFSPKPFYTKVNILQAIGSAFSQTYIMVASTLAVVFMLFTGAVSISDLAGPVGIAQITGKYAQTGLISLVFFTAFISVNIGIINLLPLPALDGFSILFRLFEGISRRKINSTLENKINGYGLVVLLGFMFLVTINDILRLFTSR